MLRFKSLGRPGTRGEKPNESGDITKAVGMVLGEYIVVFPLTRSDLVLKPHISASPNKKHEI